MEKTVFPAKAADEKADRQTEWAHYHAPLAEEAALFAGSPHAHIQWKGTSICMDVYCKCGERGHVDAEFAYNYRCPSCDRIYAVGCHVQLIELDERRRKFVEEGNECLVTDTDHIEEEKPT